MKKTRLLLVSLLLTATILASTFAIGIIRAKPPGDPKSYVVDICGPQPNAGSTTSGLLACSDVNGAISWGTNCGTGSCQFGPGTLNAPTFLAITFTWENCCANNAFIQVSLNNIALGTLTLSGFASRFNTFTIYVDSSSTAWYTSTLAPATYSLSSLNGINPHNPFCIATGCNGLSNGVNLLTYFNGQGIRGIRAVINTPP